MVGSTRPKDGWPRSEADELVKALLRRLEVARRQKWPIKRVWLAGDYVHKQKDPVEQLFVILETGNKLDKEMQFFQFLREDEHLKRITLVSKGHPAQWVDGVPTETRFEGQMELLWQGSSFRKRRR